MLYGYGAEDASYSGSGLLPDLGYPQSKSEAEFGIDLAFLSDDNRELTIFVLKDEPLTNGTWTRNDFDRDLRMAIAPDLRAQELSSVESVAIVLAYNKDDQQNGVELFERFVAAAPTKIADHVRLSLTRWNLSDLVELTIQHVLSPSLLPERFFGQLSYASAQAADFRHGSEAWQTQLIPNWRRLVEDVLAESAGSRGPALIPVALIIVRQHAASGPSSATGWIELLEWSAVALWRLCIKSSEETVAVAVRRFWSDFYLVELEHFYRTHIGDLATEHSIDTLPLGSFVGTVASAYVAHWHIARLGLLSIDLENGRNVSPPGSDERTEKFREVANWMAVLVNANVSVFRPLLDVQHIEWLLLASTFRNAGRLEDLANVIGGLVSRL